MQLKYLPQRNVHKVFLFYILWCLTLPVIQPFAILWVTKAVNVLSAPSYQVPAHGSTLHYRKLKKQFLTISCIYLITYVDQYNSVGTATRYDLDGPGIEPRLGARFSAPVQIGPWAHPASYTMSTRGFPEVKRPRRGADQPHSLAPMLKKE